MSEEAEWIVDEWILHAADAVSTEAAACMHRRALQQQMVQKTNVSIATVSDTVYTLGVYKTVISTTFYLLGIQAHFWSTRSVGSGPTRGEAPFDMVPVGKNI